MDEVALALEGEEWEQEACEPEERYRERPGVEAPQTAGEGAGGTWSGVLTLQLSADGAGEDDGPGGGEGNGGRGALRPVQRRASAADKELAQALHRTHLLCLLARALALDHATTSPLLQVPRLYAYSPATRLILSKAVCVRKPTHTLLPTPSYPLARVRLLPGPVSSP